ncbi:unnamed protein product [Polarella glacialis]|uniref:Uncharacterized protein n=1 Tax=Polarella glacialis TaxID=89957 RepID=A0A813IQD8_POLGL|nr:unnamed protein product [Polarella glacialis]CAE8655739.1 unnamed protein product [Polarella glacialis]
MIYTDQARTTPLLARICALVGPKRYFSIVEWTRSHRPQDMEESTAFFGPQWLIRSATRGSFERTRAMFTYPSLPDPPVCWQVSFETHLPNGWTWSSRLLTETNASLGR